MTQKSARLSLVFSCVGHTYAHLFAPIFFVVALALEADLGLSHGEVVALVVAGNVLYGVAAPFAGWISDKWNATGMMTVFFVGTGAGMVLTGFATSPMMIAIFLGITGLFGSIYHPVGIAWLIKNAVNRGTALGINGVFGSIGPSVAALSAGILTDLISWRAAFVVPGVLMIITGFLFMALIKRGKITEIKSDRAPQSPAARGDIIRTIMVLSITMLCTGMIYQSMSPALPKMFSIRMEDYFADGIMGISVLVAMVYIVAGGFQIVAGKLCDIYPLRLVYVFSFVAQIPIMIIASNIGGSSLLVMMMVVVAANQASLPAENSLVAKYAPAEWRGLAFGLKFILAFGVSGLAVLMEAAVYEYTGDFFWLFIILASIATVGFLGAYLLPKESRKPSLSPAE